VVLDKHVNNVIFSSKVTKVIHEQAGDKGAQDADAWKKDEEEQ